MTARVDSIPGSSPLARGLRSTPEQQGSWGGIIPARAGFTHRTWGPRPSSRDHPRSRGVYACLIPSIAVDAGSSPLARGLRLTFPGRLRPSGIIPARAGFTANAAGTSSPRRDHPRSRGVYTSSFASFSAMCGSSPLARGLLKTGHGGGAAGGIIPARAGFTRPLFSQGSGCGDHPRSRGVYLGLRDAGQASLGSSPLARGLHDRHAGELGAHRIIPARAGFTPRLSRTSGCLTDHPRSRGVYGQMLQRLATNLGSSPLARGLRTGVIADALDLGIIPARAGFTRWVGLIGLTYRDHPRSRGVYPSIGL